MKRLIKIKKNKGMTYVELIVVFSVFSIMSAVLLFNYSQFQGNVDIKALASNMALKVVQAQKASLSGLLPPTIQLGQLPAGWKSTYGVYFNPSSDNKSLLYFTDINQNRLLDDLGCVGNSECLEKINITKGDTISNLQVFYQGGASASLSDLTVSFSRPNSGTMIKSSTSFSGTVLYVQITVISPKGATAQISVYPSGRIQVN
jgi:type II secretory pathway pseudopilin PulG